MKDVAGAGTCRPPARRIRARAGPAPPKRRPRPPARAWRRGIPDTPSRPGPARIQVGFPGEIAREGLGTDAEIDQRQQLAVRLRIRSTSSIVAMPRPLASAAQRIAASWPWPSTRSTGGSRKFDRQFLGGHVQPVGSLPEDGPLAGPPSMTITAAWFGVSGL